MSVSFALGPYLGSIFLFYIAHSKQGQLLVGFTMTKKHTTLYYLVLYVTNTKDTAVRNSSLLFLTVNVLYLENADYSKSFGNRTL